MCATRRRALDLSDALARGVVSAHVAEHELRVTFDDRKQIVEVVRNAARELADGLHPHRLPETVLETLSLADVADGAQCSDDLAGRVAIGTGRHFGIDPAAVFSDQFSLVQLDLAAQPPPQFVAEHVALGRRQEQVRRVLSDHFVRLVSQHVTNPRVRQHDAIVRVRDHQGLPEILGHRSESLL